MLGCRRDSLSGRWKSTLKYPSISRSDFPIGHIDTGRHIGRKERLVHLSIAPPPFFFFWFWFLLPFFLLPAEARAQKLIGRACHKLGATAMCHILTLSFVRLAFTLTMGLCGSSSVVAFMHACMCCLHLVGESRRFFV